MVDAIVYEFHASLKDKEKRKQRGEKVICVIVQGKNVSISSREICWYYDSPYYIHDHLETLNLFTFEYFYMEGIINYLTKRRHKWTLHANTEVPLKFNTAIMFPMAMMWMQFICTRFAPTKNASGVTTYWAVMLYSFFAERWYLHRPLDLWENAKVHTELK